MLFRIHAKVCINGDKDETITVSSIHEIPDDVLFAEAKYKHVTLMKERGDVIEDMNIKLPYDNIKSFDLNGLEIGIEYTKIEVCSSDSNDDFTELYDLEDELNDNDDSDDELIDELIEEIKNIELAYDYDSHYDCYCKTQEVCGCGCDPLHNGW